jgi:ABC-type phosphate/phosphonate transport system ATPase subunit
MIAVIGSQSAGKSSLIESISGITLPRSTGTCTRLAHARFIFGNAASDPIEDVQPNVSFRTRKMPGSVS